MQNRLRHSGLGLGTAIVLMAASGGISNVFTDGTEIWRMNARDGSLCWDYTLTVTGFSGVEDTDWYNAQSIDT